MISLMDGRLVWLLCVLIGAVLIFGLIDDAEGKEHVYTNSLPSNVTMSAGDEIRLYNNSSSTLTVRQQDGLFTDGSACCVYVGSQSTLSITIPNSVGTFEWSDSNDNYGLLYIEQSLVELLTVTAKPIISVNDNVVSGTATPDTPIAVTVINPNMDSSTVIVKTDSNGNFEQKLNPTTEGDHNIYVTDKKQTTVTSYEVDEINRNLETRLSVLKVLESILRIIFGSE